jgi:hypothetical protein
MNSINQRSKVGSNDSIVAFGFNLIHIGHHNKPQALVPLAQVNSKPVYRCYSINRKGVWFVEKEWDLKEYLQYLIDVYPRLNRIWVQNSEGNLRCVYWYQQGVLTL